MKELLEDISQTHWNSFLKILVQHLGNNAGDRVEVVSFRGEQKEIPRGLMGGPGRQGDVSKHLSCKHEAMGLTTHTHTYAYMHAQRLLADIRSNVL